ncbi:MULTISPECIES: hypothetical protein [Enterobacteriaceae]|nr:MULTISPECIES: hypothetical protein [Enterobacteriaceae]MCA6797476.1 hypothetical protein [Escherichia coli]MCA8445711.1 hypothetical protein [Escherichia coli]MCA8544270.1 hypothetical protein [Escherichia coli]MCA8563125.1 hypothetical protein [Escherichia coli]MCA8571984.1 hypothetical protein [Escherichia coli]
MKEGWRLDDIFGDSIKEIRERDKKFLPEVSWFSNMDIEKLNDYMTKYPFDSFESIPKDDSGLTFPVFENIIFTLPVRYRHCPTRIVYVDGLAFLKKLGDGAFCIDPRRWHKIKKYISKGYVEYPEASNSEFGVSDGRHRTLLLMQLYNRKTVPVVVAEREYEKFILDAKANGAI